MVKSYDVEQTQVSCARLRERIRDGFRETRDLLMGLSLGMTLNVDRKSQSKLDGLLKRLTKSVTEVDDCLRQIDDLLKQ